jgi:glycosyltransferase involved in cell wall biosynthesis
MKILQIMGGYSDGGAEIFYIDALSALNNINIEQYAILNKKNKKGIKRLEELNIPFKIVSFNKIFKLPSKLIISKVIKDFNPDIVHYWMGRACSFLIKGEHINIGWHSGYRGVERFRACDYHIALTSELKKHIVSQGIDQNKVYELPIYTHKNISKKIVRKDFDTPEDKPLLLSLSRLHPVKGIDTLLEAMAKVPEAFLWIAGSGPLEKKLINQSQRLGLSERVKFLGWREDKEALMATSDICVFPSRNDAFGAVIIEAWAAKKPNIACKSPGPRTIISNNHNGLLVEIDDVSELVDAIKKVINNKKLGNSLANNGYKKFIENYSEKAFSKNIIKIYSSIIKLKNK